MLRSKKLKPVIKLAGHREKQAARILSQSRQSHAELKNGLIDLERHRKSYARQLEARARKGMNAIAFRQAQKFLTQIDTAIEQQKQNLYCSQQVVKTKTAGWKTDKMKQRMMQNVNARIEKEELNVREKRAQRDLDDRVGRGFYQKTKP